jgi:Shikimate 5'-dehydrogenase C-terminal domain
VAGPLRGAAYDARPLGCRTQDGGDMAVFQAAMAFRLFTGIVPDSLRMRRRFAAMGRARQHRGLLMPSGNKGD